MAMKNELLKKHYSQLCFEAGLRSALFGLSLGFAAAFVLSALEWLLDFGASWISVLVFVIVFATSGVLLYVFKYRPDTADAARRLDRLGLDERMITMLDYEGDDSYIASLQRENARDHFKNVENKKLRLHISRALIAISVSASVLGISMITVLALSESGLIPSGSTIISGDEFIDYIPVSYIVDEGGYITGGEADQLVVPGGDADPVVAEAEDGWVFVGWDDNSTDPARHDKNITEPREYIAIFEPIEEEEEDEDGEGGASSEEEEADQSSDQPSNDDSSESDGSQQEEQDQESEDGEPGDNEDQNEGNASTDDSEDDSGSNGQGSGGKWEETNMFYDGQTYYKDAMDYYEDYYDDDSSIPPELREFFELYFGSL